MMRGLTEVENNFEAIDLDELQALFVEAQKKVSDIGVKEVILVLGQSGNGKSTFIDYMLECPLELVDDPDTGDQELRLSDSETSRAAVIGGLNAGSKTIFPQVYGEFCDTGGFMDSRGLCFKIAIDYAIRSVLVTASRVKAVVLVFKEAQLDSDKAGYAVAEAIKEVAGLLGPEKSEYQPSLLVAFNRCRRNRTQIINKLAEICGNLSKSNYASEQEVGYFLSKMLERPDNIQVLNHEDRGESRDIVRKFLSRAQGIGNSYKAYVSSQLCVGPYYGYLKNLSEGVSGKILPCYQQLKIQLILRERLLREIEELDVHASHLKGLSLRTGAAISEDVKKTMEKNKTLLDGKKTQLKKCETEILGIKKKLTDYQPKLEMLRRLCTIIKDLMHETSIVHVMGFSPLKLKQDALHKYFQSDFQGGLADMNLAIELLDSTSLSFKAEILKWRGELKRMCLDYQGALKDLNEGLALEKDNHEMLGMKFRGAVKVCLGDYSSAMEDLEKSLQARPEDQWIKDLISQASRALSEVGFSLRY